MSKQISGIDDRIIKFYSLHDVYLPAGHPLPTTSFKFGDRILIDINDKSHNVGEAMKSFKYNHKWLTVNEVNHGRSFLLGLSNAFSDFLESYAVIDGWSFAWYHISKHIPAGEYVELDTPSIPID